jgi:hypothetical protein
MMPWARRAASAASARAGVPNRASTKLHRLGTTSMPSSASEAASHARQVSLWVRLTRTNSVSSSAATPAASAAALTLNGPRSRLSTSAIPGGQ